MTKKIRVGLIGASVDAQKSWGARAHVPALRHLPAYELVALSTSRMETAKVAALHYGVPLAFDNGVSLAKHADVDLVVVAVRAQHQPALVQAAIAAGKHVVCEWPMGGTTAHARDMRDAAQAAGVYNMTGLQAYGHQTLRYVRDLIAQGYIGRVVSTNWSCRQEHFGPVQHSLFAQLADESQGTDLMRVATGHALSAIDCCLGMFEQLNAVVSTQFDRVLLEDTGQWIPKTAPDQILISGSLANGAVASVHMMGGATRTAGTRIEINGTEGDILLNSSGGANVHRAEFELRVGRGGTMDVTPVPARYNLDAAYSLDEPAVALAHLYADFARRIASEPVQVPDFAMGVRIAEVLDALRIAGRSGARQRVHVSASSGEATIPGEA